MPIFREVAANPQAKMPVEARRLRQFEVLKENILSHAANGPEGAVPAGIGRMLSLLTDEGSAMLFYHIQAVKSARICEWMTEVMRLNPEIRFGYSYLRERRNWVIEDLGSLHEKFNPDNLEETRRITDGIIRYVNDIEAVQMRLKHEESGFYEGHDFREIIQSLHSNLNCAMEKGLLQE